MVVVTFVSLLMVMATRLVVLMYGSERASRSRVVAALGLDRLADQFRRDVRMAEKVLHVRPIVAARQELPPASTPGQPRWAVLLRLQVSGAVVEYAEADGYVTRRAALPGGDPSPSQSPEQFRLADTARVAIEETAAGPGRVLTLSVREAGAAEGSPVLRLRAQATLGADLRFARPAAKEAQ
jgi:hypothetical protein